MLQPRKRRTPQPHYNHASRKGDRAHVRRYRDDIDDDSLGSEEEDDQSGGVDIEDNERASDEDGEDNDEAAPLLPIFSAAHLDALPVYSLTHAVRLLIVQRCETTLSWEQLRSPQISQFLIKPIQQQIRTSHFNRATLYALLANCLQFNKEAQISPGNAGICRTRGLVSELLAMRLLKEFSLRELIDALSYDYDPLQGASPPPTGYSSQGAQKLAEIGPRGQIIRTSTLEVAIRAQAKRFLAHPLCVQHLESIWAGSIVFHSAADSLHRYPSKPPPNDHRHYGATHTAGAPSVRSYATAERSREMVRRSVTLYNPKDASLFKLSRLRVPRYRNAFSTISYAIMLGLFLAVLNERSLDITALEVIFWFWSAGFMLDEVVGFSEQGFSLYIMSVWNAFDIGILLLFFAYYILRLYGILLAGEERHHVADMAYDVLATTAVLLFPRWFAFLDHYPYFSQLLIAFRLMALDLVAVLLLIGITCSGFFVAFTLSFGAKDHDGPQVAYDLFQIIMGFTPAAWNVWGSYNILGKIILTIFLMICHFLVVTILITVLTNSFMAIVKNANEEHQFLFAVNVLSMVKSDALFSYVAPSNVVGWCFSPLRYCMPFRHYVRVNRTVIKATHFPVLFTIFIYERIHLSRYAIEPEGLVQARGRQRARLPTFAQVGDQDALSPAVGALQRRPSMATQYKDQALEEVFARPYRGASTIRTARSQTLHVDDWMNQMGGVASPPQEETRSLLEQLETTRRPPLPRSATSLALTRRLRSESRSLALSEPGDPPRFRRPSAQSSRPRYRPSFERPHTLQAIDLDADDEIAEGDEDEIEPSTSNTKEVSDDGTRTPTPKPSRFPANPPSGSPKLGHPSRVASRHDRQASTSTILYKPDELDGKGGISSSNSSRKHLPLAPQSSPLAILSPTNRLPSRPQTQGKRPMRADSPLRARPILPPRNQYQSTPNFTRFVELGQRAKNRDRSFDALALDLASDIGDNRPYAENMGMQGEIAGSLNSHFLGYPTATRQRQKAQREKTEAEQSSMMSRLVLARMNTLEEGFKDILKEVKDWRSAASSRGTSDVGGGMISGGGGVSGLTVAQRRVARKMEKERALERKVFREAGISAPTTPIEEGSKTPERMRQSGAGGAEDAPTGDENDDTPRPRARPTDNDVDAS